MKASAPTELQLDALRELANVGCGRAADALSRLLGGRTVGIDVPSALSLEGGQVPKLLGDEKAAVVAACLKVEGELSGELLMVFSERDAQRWCELLLKAPARKPLSAEERSVLEETANIAASACLNAMGALTGLRLLPSVPQLSESGMQALLERVLVSVTQEAPKVVLATRLWVRSSPPIEGQIVFLPHRTSVKRLLERLGV